ncbi:MAG: Flp family type IVb pilin [Blastochloris sp.]|nr:Flp family type IVb pilin [Blastochloris sp.]
MAGRMPQKGVKGQTLVEYALILVLVTLAAVATLTLLGNQLSNFFILVTDSLGNI